MRSASPSPPRPDVATGRSPSSSWGRSATTRTRDAALFFCSEVLPRLRAAAREPLRVLLVGTNPSARVRALARAGEVTVTGAVPALAEYYAAADAVVVPLRAGGGTRIKVLEAFSHRRPVVSTGAGAQGIDARRETHLLIADTPRAFAEQCVRLIQGPRLRRELATRAFRFVKAHHTPALIRELLRRDHRRHRRHHRRP